MICCSVNRLFLMHVILLQVERTAVDLVSQDVPVDL